MNNTEMIKELRALTQAGMKDCKDALEESNWNLDQAVDIVKKKGLNIVSGREGKVASEGVVVTGFDGFLNESKPVISMVEVNCQTDFVANSEGFRNFAQYTADLLASKTLKNEKFDLSDVEEKRQEVVASTKENVVVRRWWAEQALDDTVMVFKYVHSNNKIGVLLTMKVGDVSFVNNPKFLMLGQDLVLQVASMNPLEVSPDKLSTDVVSRQLAIFEAQLKEANKPEKSWAKILEGKTNKWHTEVCLLKQESVIYPKMSVEKVLEDVSKELGTEVTVVSFVRCEVGEGLNKVTSNLAEEVSKMTASQ